ncbi:MAG TPA: class GN sortase [Thermoanaerobaculia bacterium]|nr:class GN sortase [Thermoanaerobaculia bacterium]
MKRVLIALALIAIAASAWIHVKAQLAQVLLRVAWHRQTKPWPWADTHPVARMIVGDDDLIVLEGSNGRALAFAPGHLEHTAMPGEPGNCVISAHRDTHFSALRDVRAGDVIRVQRTDGRWVEYTVAEQRVVDKRDVWVTRSSGETTLTLVTCYPFDAIVAGGPQRYVLTARTAAAVRNVSARPPMFHESNPSTSFPSRTTAHDIPRMSMRAPVGGMPNSSP